MQTYFIFAVSDLVQVVVLKRKKMSAPQLKIWPERSSGIIEEDKFGNDKMDILIDEQAEVTIFCMRLVIDLSLFE